MELKRQIFAIISANGVARISKEQKALLVGKAKWVYDVASFSGAKNDIKTVPTICITRAAWERLKEEKSDKSELRKIWVKTLFKLTNKDNVSPLLAVRTSAKRHYVGLMRAKLNIKAPATIEQSVDVNCPLAKAIDLAFASYSFDDPVWSSHGVEERARQIVIIQQQAKGELVEFATRDLQTGKIGPASAIRGDILPQNFDVKNIISLVDKLAGRHILCLVAKKKSEITFVSARAIKASARAEFEASVDRVQRGVCTTKQAVMGLDVEHLEQVLHPRISSAIDKYPIANGIGVSPGAASGEIVFTSEDAMRAHARSIKCILVVNETGPSDIDGMKVADGIITARGGQNSHAAIIARVSAKPCVTGVNLLDVNLNEMTCNIGDKILRAGDKISIDGGDGRIFLGSLTLLQPDIGETITKLLNWSDGSRTIDVRTNVETVESAETALNFGAEGIGLARSEHMFFTHERMLALRKLIFSNSDDDRKIALKGLVKYQSNDYAKLFISMGARPVTVRLFDPPLHEFLPKSDEDIEETAKSLNIETEILRQRLEKMNEINPMLGNRGCRLAISHPEILQMQIHAMFEGAKEAQKYLGESINLEIMVPFVASLREVQWLRNKVDRLIKFEEEKSDFKLNYIFGTMIELPRAALRAGEIAPMVDFFSFGTNDLTQTCFGISRDDSPAFLAAYKKEGIYDIDPFASVDVLGVGELIKIAIARGKEANPNLKIGICGEHAGDPASIRFFASLDIDYISCSPYRVPIARLALAQAQA